MLLADQGLATPDMWRDNGFLGGWVAHNVLVGNRSRSLAQDARAGVRPKVLAGN